MGNTPAHRPLPLALRLRLPRRSVCSRLARRGGVLVLSGVVLVWGLAVLASTAGAAPSPIASPDVLRHGLFTIGTGPSGSGAGGGLGDGAASELVSAPVSDDELIAVPGPGSSAPVGGLSTGAWATSGGDGGPTGMAAGGAEHSVSAVGLLAAGWLVGPPRQLARSEYRSRLAWSYTLPLVRPG